MNPYLRTLIQAVPTSAYFYTRDYLELHDIIGAKWVEMEPFASTPPPPQFLKLREWWDASRPVAFIELQLVWGPEKYEDPAHDLIVVGHKYLVPNEFFEIVNSSPEEEPGGYGEPFLDYVDGDLMVHEGALSAGVYNEGFPRVYPAQPKVAKQITDALTQAYIDWTPVPWESLSNKQTYEDVFNHSLETYGTEIYKIGNAEIAYSIWPGFFPPEKRSTVPMFHVKGVDILYFKAEQAVMTAYAYLADTGQEIPDDNYQQHIKNLEARIARINRGSREIAPAPPPLPTWTSPWDE